ncbi:MAG: serine/threonine protein kinase, partial [Moorea sp. SIO2B7]|nr:serine/threonine protein kinase [Moorena sp. SIO2B7]
PPVAPAVAITQAGATGGAMAGSVAGIIVGILSLSMAWSGAVAAAGTAVLSSAIAGLVGAAIAGVGTGMVVEDLLRKGIEQNFAVCISLLTTASGISLGLSFVLGLLNPLVIFAVMATSLPLFGMILYPYLRWAKVLADYRKAEEHLVKP